MGVILGFDIVYIDDDLLIIDKPAGLLSVPGRLPENFDSVALRLQRDLDAHIRTVHRLDQDTSGLMVYARHADAHRELSRQFHDREVDKVYQAIVHGRLQDEEGEVRLPLRYDPDNKPRHIVDTQLGKAALTLWRVCAYETSWTRVDLVPYTGRSHQLRVHMQSLGHAIRGDRLYAPQSADEPRLCLHARHLALTHPGDGRRLHWDSPPPF